ncbi:hypothetical protein A6279_26645 [Bacillus wiedmannii]|uniref:Uncharacterized protein n=1 Tax=Bacillus wiedmannii TaxID=1890302 RepID=A0A1G6K0G5_9BACI|nr:hypothetical protein IEI_02199 [Bacillus wiedmannii]EOP11149.1 hypothetical protein ICS_02748 [Bacillus cereus BAG2O-3]EOQ11287.1 hypothetical protein KQ3_02142 [Bacillus cereus B5-2]EOQ30135.1 hypothetical protein KQ1_02805 [Bacillus cereus BAG3O-1]OJD53954.1 hypothetical protein BAU22_03770 [Bacillus sp. 4048]
MKKHESSVKSDSCLVYYLMFCFLWINEAERRMTMPFKIYTFTIEKVRLTAPKLALLNIEVKAEVVKKIMGVNSKNMKPATILLLKLC